MAGARTISPVQFPKGSMVRNRNGRSGVVVKAYPAAASVGARVMVMTAEGEPYPVAVWLVADLVEPAT
jgi:hypothetical protein